MLKNIAAFAPGRDRPFGAGDEPPFGVEHPARALPVPTSTPTKVSFMSLLPTPHFDEVLRRRKARIARRGVAAGDESGERAVRATTMALPNASAPPAALQAGVPTRDLTDQTNLKSFWAADSDVIFIPYSVKASPLEAVDTVPLIVELGFVSA